MDYTQIIQAIIALLTALISAFFIPWLKAKVDAETLKKVSTYVDIAVSAAEQIYTAVDGEAKKAYVLKYLADKGIQFDSETIDNLIEASVLKLHHELFGGDQNGAAEGTK